jgi:hypothetical protein
MSNKKQARIAPGERTIQSPLGPDVEEFLAKEMARLNAPHVGRPREHFRNLFIMCWVEMWRANPTGETMLGLKAAINQVVKEAKEEFGLDLRCFTIETIYEDYKYPTMKKREPNFLEEMTGLMPMTDRELREQYRAEGMTLDRLITQFRLIHARVA